MSSESPDIELPKSRLALRDGVLEKSADNGKLVARHELREISRISLTWKVEYVTLLIALLFAGLAYVSYTYLDWPWLRWSAAVISMLLTCLFAALSHQQYVELACGEDTVQYNLVDPRDENEGFVVTLKREFERARYGKREIRDSGGSRDGVKAGLHAGPGQDPAPPPENPPA